MGFATVLAATLLVALLLRFAVVTDYLYHGLVKDPERVAPPGRVIVAPADGIVLYVRRVDDGVIPHVVKRGVPIPLGSHAKFDDGRFPDGVLIGIYMSWNGVHVNRVPIGGRIAHRSVFNGPHMDMSAAERTIILTQLIPGWVSVKKLLGLPPYAIEDESEYVTRSARETLVIDDSRGAQVYVVRIADYVVGKILTWVREGEGVETGQRLGMITSGSQTDLFIEATSDLAVLAREGAYVYAGETILATY